MTASDFETPADNQGEQKEVKTTAEQDNNDTVETRGEDGRLCQWDVEGPQVEGQNKNVSGEDWDSENNLNKSVSIEQESDSSENNEKYGLNIAKLDEIIDSEEYGHRISRATGKIGEELVPIKKEAKEVARILAKRYGDLHGYKYEADQSEQKLNYKDEETRINVAESIRSDLLNHIKSDAYREKLAIGIDSEEDVTKEQDARIKLLEQTKIQPNLKRGSEESMAIAKELVENTADYKKATPEEQKQMIDAQQKHHNDVAMLGFYYPDKKTVYVFDDQNTKQVFEGTIQHELGHATTAGNERLLERTKNIFDKSFTNKFGNNFSTDKSINAYLSNSTERQTRKEKLDKRLESLGIKKYDEKFTKDHFDMIQILNKMHIFDEDEQDFIDTTNMDFETYKEIFDTIADNDVQGNQNELIG
jgi:hypothetical protein